MKNKFLVYSFYIFFISTISFAQQVSLNEIRNYYKSFNYQKVIEFSDALLSENILTKDEVIELETMKAVSFYSLNDESSARKSFIEILKLDKNYTLDPSFISPKIISLFDSTKKDFIQIFTDKPEEQIEKNIPEEKPLQVETHSVPDNSFLLKSILIPGWGHFSKSNELKSWLVTSAGIATLGSMIYYIIDSNDKEKLYLNETDPILIKQKYDSFNTSYKTRNTLIAAYAAVWLFTQLDLLVFDTEYGNLPIAVSPNFGGMNDIAFTLQMNF